ncbi:MAG: ATP-binding protein [Candidatus Sedimenticola sp. 6PFRAG7]
MTIRWKLFLTIVTALSVNLAVSHYAAHKYKQAHIAAAEIRDTSYLVVTTALSAQVHFKKQVQEWKNILLRGHVSESYEKYHGQFLREEEITRAKITQLISMLGEEETASRITASSFLAAHHRLGFAYRSALEAFDRSSLVSHLELDRQVQGIDREPTDLIDQVVSASLEYKKVRLEKVTEDLNSIENRILIVLVTLLALTVIIFLILANHQIARPVQTATEIARRISAGDFSGDIPKGGTDETGQLLRALDSMRSNLQTSQQKLREEQNLLAHRVEERTQELNIANEELARAAKAKDLFLATMSHELRTPLTTILGLTEMLKDQLYGPINESQDKSLGTIDESSRHLLALINDILDVAKIESGKMELNWDYIPAAQLIEGSLRLVRQPAQRKHLKIEYTIDPEINLIHGDSRRLKQVLVNLLGNAVKFTPEHESIGLDVTLASDRSHINLTVWDNGIGIHLQDQKQLFQPFIQLDNAATRRYSGTGLGLTLVNRMAQLHGGSISVTSEPNKGSRFTFSLPWNSKDNEPKQLSEAMTSDADMTSGVDTGDIHVLFAEDNPNNRLMISEFLRHQGFKVTLAQTGSDVLSQSQAARPDLILMDIQLKDMDGREVTRMLREVPGLSHTPIIALTAQAMPGDRESCLDAGMDDYLSKPVGLKEILNHIISFLKKRRLL